MRSARLANNGGWVSSGRDRYALGIFQICVTTKLRNTAGFCRSPYYIYMYIGRLKTKDLPAFPRSQVSRRRAAVCR